MQRFTLDQAIVTALLFLLGLLIGMFLMAGRKWKRRYLDERILREQAEAENARLAAQLREHESLRHAAAKAPAQVSPVQAAPVQTTPVQTTVVREETRVVETPAEPYRRVAPPRGDGDPDIVIRRS